MRAEIPDYDRRVAGGEVARVMPTRKQGGTGANQFTKEGESKDDNVRSAKAKYGNSKTYLISRLKRDAADPACPGRTQARHWLKRLDADLARRQTDPASPEFVKPEGAKGIGKRVSNTDALSGTDRNSKPGTLRRLARSRPDLLARVESGELSAHAAAVEAGIRKPMRSIPVDTPEAAIRALLRAWPVPASSRFHHGGPRRLPVGGWTNWSFADSTIVETIELSLGKLNHGSIGR